MSIVIFAAQNDFIQSLPHLYEGDIHLSRINVGCEIGTNNPTVLTDANNKPYHMYGFSWTLNVDGTLEHSKGYHEIISGYDLADAIERFNRFIRCMASGKSYGEAIRLADTIDPLSGCYEHLAHTTVMADAHAMSSQPDAKKNGLNISHRSPRVSMTHS